MNILVDVINQKIKIATNFKSLIAGTQKFIRFTFNLTGDWDDLTTFAQFQQNGLAYNVYLDDNNSVELPPEIGVGTCTILLYGSNNETIAITDHLTLIIDRNNFISDANSTEITESLYNQLVDRVEDLSEQIDEFPTNISEFANDAGYQTETQVRNLIEVAGGISEAPTDGKQYARQNAAWTEVGAVATVNGIAPDESGNVQITIPESGGNAALTTAQISALDGMFKVCSFASADVSAEYNAFKTAFGISDSGGEEEPDNPEVTLSSISATYSGGNVAVGTAVTALTGIVVTAHYSDGSSQTVTGYALSGTITEGSNTVTVSYGGKTTTFTVNGVAESGGDEVTIYEPEANIVVTTTLDIDNTLVNVDTGATSTNTSWCASDYVAIPVGKDYLAIQPENTANIRYALYDSAKAFIEGGILSGVTALAIEYPDNAAYIRLSTNNKTGIGTVTLSAGNTMVTNWGDPGNNGLADDGTISTSSIVYRISDGYVKIPVGAKTLFWCNKSGYSFTKTRCAVYDDGYNGVGVAGESTLGGGSFGQNFTQNKIDLTVMDNVMYFKAQVNDASDANNNNPAEQYVFGYI